MFFFFKQKTAYEMRISDWSSDVCSSDLVPDGGYVDYANTKKAPGYTLLGIEGGIDIADGFRIFVEGRNLADKRYVGSYTTVTTYEPAQENFYPGEGRSVFAGFTASF